MKKKLLILLTIITIFGFNRTVNADSYSSSSEMSNKIKVITAIQNWTNYYNNLVYRVGECELEECPEEYNGWSYDYNGYYNKTAYLQGTLNGTNKIENLTYQDYNFSSFNFDEGSTVNLVELYDFDEWTSNHSPAENEFISDYSGSFTEIIGEDKLGFSWELDVEEIDEYDQQILAVVRENTFNDSKLVEYDMVWNSSIPSENRHIVSYAYISNPTENENEYEKVNIVNRNIIVPRYQVRGNLSAGGNIAGVADFTITISDHDGRYLKENGLFCMYEENLENNPNYHYIPYFKYKELIDAHGIPYGSGGDNVPTVYTYGDSWYDALMDTSCDNDAICTLTFTQSGSSNISVPNGLYYAIIPFTIILIVAGAGIVILKKNKIKE